MGVTGGTPDRSSPEYKGWRVEDYILGKQELLLFPLSRYVHGQINRREKTYSLHLFWPSGCRHFNHCVLNADSLFGMLSNQYDSSDQEMYRNVRFWKEGKCTIY